MNGFPLLALMVGWGVAIALGALWLVLLYLIIIGRIDLRLLISESNGDASMSRFQFLMFSFVIALSLFLVTISSNPLALPTVPPEILGLLGISGGSYVLAKGIQTSGNVGMQQAKVKEMELEQPTESKKNE